MEKPFGFLDTLKNLALHDDEEDKSDVEETGQNAAAAQAVSETFKSEAVKQRE